MNIIDSFSIIGLKIVKFLSVATASTMLVASSYTAWDMYHTEKAAFSSYDLSKYRPQVESGEPATIEDVSEINDDARAWLTVYSTHIDYPVTQGKDDLEYVNKDIYGNTSPTGSIYLASQNSAGFSDPYNLMYGHHMDNGAMFGDVDNFLEKDYFESHTKGILVTPSAVYDLDLIGSIETTAQDRTVYSPKRTGLGIMDYLKTHAVQYREPGEVAKVLALSTCDYERTNGRDVVFFKMSPHEGAYEKYDIIENEVPLAGHGNNYWALLNLLCMIVTVYNFVPLHVILSKYRRKKVMKDRNSLFEEEDGETPKSLKEKLSAWLEDNGLKKSDNGEEDDSLYDTKKFGRRQTVGASLELLTAAGAVLAFILTEDMRLPIKIIDEWTPLMLALLFLTWFIDVRALRLGFEEEDEEEEAGTGE